MLSDAADLRDERLLVVLGTTFRDGAVPLELSQVTGIALGTVRDRLKALAAAGVVVDVGNVPCGRARPYKLWALPQAVATPEAAARCLVTARGRLAGTRVRTGRVPRRARLAPPPLPTVHVPRRRPAAIVHDPAARALLSCIRRAAAPIPVAEIAERTGTPADLLRVRLEVLRATGDVHLVHRTRVIVTERLTLRETCPCYTADPAPIRIPPVY